MAVRRLPSLGTRRCTIAIALICSGLAHIATAAPQERRAGCDAPVLTLSEAAALLRVDATALEQLAEQNGVPGRRIGTEWRFECGALLDWLGMRAITGRGLSAPQDPAPATAPTPQDPNGAAAPIGEAPEDRTAEDVFLRGNRLLLGRGDVVMDFGQFYTRRDSVQLAAFGSSVGLATVQDDAFSTVVFGRVGIFRETEFFAGTTFNSQNSEQLAGNASLGRVRNSGFGSATLGVRRTMLREGPKRPNVVLSLQGQVPTGDLLPSLGGGVVLLKSLDPVVLFANANYVHPFERSSSPRTPIDSVDLSLGYGLGLNDSTAISMAVGGLFARTASTDTGPLKVPSAFSLRMSITTALGAGLYLEPSVSLGLSGPAQTFGFGITMPYTF